MFIKDLVTCRHYNVTLENRDIMTISRLIIDMIVFKDQRENVQIIDKIMLTKKTIHVHLFHKGAQVAQ